MTVKNSLDSFINREIGKRMANSGIKVNKGDIMNEVANHCDVGVENIKRINRNVAQPSLKVALKIADYFNEKVENIFKIC